MHQMLIPPNLGDADPSQQPLYLLHRQHGKIWLYNLRDEGLYAALTVKAMPTPNTVGAPACGTWMKWSEWLFLLDDDEMVRLLLNSDRYGMCEYEVALDSLSEITVSLFDPVTVPKQPDGVQAYLGGKYNMRHEQEWEIFMLNRDDMYAKVRAQHTPRDAALLLHLNDLFYRWDFIDASLDIHPQGCIEYLPYAELLFPVIQQIGQTCPMTLLQQKLIPVVRGIIKKLENWIPYLLGVEESFDDFMVGVYLAAVGYQRQSILHAA